MKKLVAMTLCATMVFSLAACGQKADNPETQATSNDTKTEAKAKNTSDLDIKDFQYNALDYVTLGEYKGLDVAITPSMDYEYSDEGLAEYVNNNMIAASSAGAYYEDDSQTVVAEDSIVNVDYTGYLDGEAFQGGAATDVLLDVANNRTPGGSGYIDGFSSGLVGAKVGETVDCDVTFPENYTAELAGKAVVFRFKVNYICGVMDYDHLTDEYVSKNFGHDSVEDFMTSAKEGYESFRQQAKDSDLRGEVSRAVINGATVSEVPESLLNARVEDTIHILMNRYGASSEEELDTIWQSDANMQGATVADYREYLKNRMGSTIQTEMILVAVFEQEGMELSDAEFDAYLKDHMSDGSSKEDMFASYGSTAEIGELYLRQLAKANKALLFCADNANVTYTEASAE